MSVQFTEFADRGFALHGVPIGNHRYSAWYDRAGRLLDCERTTWHRERSVPMRHALIRAELHRLGRRYAAYAAAPKHDPIPDDFPVRPIGPEVAAQDRVACGHCGLSWDDAIGTAWTPAPSGRCPFEYFHRHL